MTISRKGAIVIQKGAASLANYTEVRACAARSVALLELAGDSSPGHDMPPFDSHGLGATQVQGGGRAPAGPLMGEPRLLTSLARHRAGAESEIVPAQAGQPSGGGRLWTHRNASASPTRNPPLDPASFPGQGREEQPCP